MSVIYKIDEFLDEARSSTDYSNMSTGQILHAFTAKSGFNYEKALRSLRSAARKAKVAGRAQEAQRISDAIHSMPRHDYLRNLSKHSHNNSIDDHRASELAGQAVDKDKTHGDGIHHVLSKSHSAKLKAAESDFSKSNNSRDPEMVKKHAEAVERRHKLTHPEGMSTYEKDKHNKKLEKMRS